jgi:hypothetical protein
MEIKTMFFHSPPLLLVLSCMFCGHGCISLPFSRWRTVSTLCLVDGARMFILQVYYTVTQNGYWSASHTIKFIKEF